jgi:hypothetical protein
MAQKGPPGRMAWPEPREASMPENSDFKEKLQKLRSASDRAVDIIRASDQTREIQLSPQPKGALIILSCSGRDKRIRFEVTETDESIVTPGIGGLSLNDERLAEHIASAIENTIAKDLG